MTKILIAEDDPQMLSLLATLLEIEGFDVCEYSETTPIAQTVKTEQPAIVLLDIHLPNENGLEVSRQIKNNPTTRGTCVILQSGMDLEDASKAAQANHFLLKPYMPETLIDLLHSVANT